jgi:hypothetical protein
MGSGVRSDPKRGYASSSLVDLDDPSMDGLGPDDEAAPDTARPDYEPAKFARHVESAKERMTSPPSPTYEMLRDSCKAQIADEIPLDEEQILRPSSRKLTPQTR